MMHRVKLLGAVVGLALVGFGCETEEARGPAPEPSKASGPEKPNGAGLDDRTTGKETAQDSLLSPLESKHLRNLRQLTFAAENAEAYFSADGEKLIFQSSEGVECDQIFIMNRDGSDRHMVSDGAGKTTCSYFFPDGKRVLYATTRFFDADCPAPPDYQKYGYVWPIYKGYDIVVADADGSKVHRLTENESYDAEGTLDTPGERIVFTSDRDGDLEIYSMNADGSNVQRLTHSVGPDGGPFYSPDGTKIVFRAHVPEGAERDRYLELIREHLFVPTQLEICVMNADGSGRHEVTHNGKANFAPFWHPDGKRIIFASNMHDPNGRDFDLYMINEDGTGLERITDDPNFDGFPMFTRDGRYLVFASNRHNRAPHDTNVFIAEWVQ